MIPVNKFKSALLLICALFCYISGEAQIATEIPVSYDVTPGGAFQYTVPVRIPPGIKGLVPNLAISYSSQAGNSAMGVGWSLSGLSAITRGNLDIYHDGQIAPVDYNSDALYLDGQRLFDISSGLYLTEVKSFAKIQYNSTGGDFTVTQPNGIVYKYGHTLSSKMLGQGRTDVYMWAISSIEDPYGNVVNFVYDNYSSTGEYRIKEITYAEHLVATTTNPVKIEFNYMDRVDTNSTWFDGSEVKAHKLLQDIVVSFSNNTPANKYEFTYDNLANLSRLIKIEEIRAGSTALPPININWGTTSTTPTISYPSVSTSNRVLNAGDFNGDGFSDIAAFNAFGAPGVDVFINDKLGGFASAVSVSSSITGGENSSVKGVQIAGAQFTFDYDGDGLDDLVIVNADNSNSNVKSFTLWLYRSNGSSTVFDTPTLIYSGSNIATHNTNFNSQVRFTAGDYDGDKKTEIIFAQPYNFNSSTSVNAYDVYIVGDNYGWHAIDHFSYGHIDGVLTFDYNGDGKDEYVFNHIISGTTPSSMVYGLKLSYDGNLLPQLVQTSTTWPQSLLCSSGYPHTYQRHWVGDYNGDGKADIIAWDVNNSQWYIAYSDGAYDSYTSHPPIQVVAPMSAELSTSGPSSTNGDYDYYAADFNGDGMTDFIQMDRTLTTRGPSYYDIFYSTGTSFIHEEGTMDMDPDRRHMAIGDFNGDGQADLVNGYSPYGGLTIAYFQKDNKTLTVASIEHAGKELNVEYKSLPQDGDYVTASCTNNYLYQVRTYPIRIVKNINDNVSMSNTYSYEGLVFHKYGLGVRGFEKFIMENIAGQKSYQNYNMMAKIPYLSESKLYDALGSIPYGMKTTYTQIDENGGALGMSRIVMNYPQSVSDYISAQETVTSIVTGPKTAGTVFYEYGAIAMTVTQKKDLNGNSMAYSQVRNGYGTSGLSGKGKPDSVTVYGYQDPSGNNSITRLTTYAYNVNGDIDVLTTDPATLNEKKTSFFYNNDFGNLERTEIDAAEAPGAPALPIITDVSEYSTDGRFKTKEIDAEGYTEQNNYGTLATSWGNVITHTSQLGVTETHEYDEVNRLVKTIHNSYNTISGSATLETYNTYEFANPSSPYVFGTSGAYFMTSTTTNDNQSISGSVVDVYGREIRNIKTDFNIILQDFGYDNRENLIASTSPYLFSSPSLKVTTVTDFDDYNRPILKTVDNGGAQISMSYDVSSGLLATTTSNLSTGNSRTSKTCGGMLLEITGPNETINYTYYGNGAPATVVTNGMTVQNYIDAYGRTTGNLQPNAGTTSKVYDALDRVTEETLGTGVTYQFKHDKLGRVIEKKHATASQIYTYTYHPASATQGLPGQLQEVKKIDGAAACSTTYNYTIQGWLQTKIYYSTVTPVPFSYTYNYYPDGKLQSYLYPGDVGVKYTYDNISGALRESATFATTRVLIHKLWHFSNRNAYGELTGAYLYDPTNNNAYAISRGFNIHGYPIRRDVINATTLAGGPIVNHTYSYNPVNGNMLHRGDTLRGFRELFDYDTEFDRLTNVNHVSPSMPPLTMTYATNGNILSKSDVSNSVTFPGVPWKYIDYALDKVPDPASSSPSFEIPSLTLDCDYTDFQKIATVLESTQNRVDYIYGADDERIKAIYYGLGGAAGGTPKFTKYYSENYELIVDHATGLETSIYYAWADGDLVGVFKVVDNPATTTIVSSNIYYPIVDQLGSITHLLNDIGTGGLTGNGIVEERSYDAWGRIRNPNTWVPYASSNPSTGTFPNWIIDRGYTGHEHIRYGTWNNNIINMDGRLYDPLIGRMFSPDPYIPNPNNSQDYNKYTYARNNPLKYTDPDGEWVQIAIGAAVGGVVNLGIQAIKGNVNTFGQGLKYFGVGAASGALASATGMWVGGAVGAGGFLGGAASGGASGFVGGFTGGAGNAWVGGASFVDGINSGLSQGAIGAIGGVLIGGTVGGVRSLSHGETFWSGKDASIRHGGGPEDEGFGRKFRQLSKGEIKALNNSGQWNHHDKGASGSKFDLYKDSKGNVYQTLKGNPVDGEILDIGINIYNILKGGAQYSIYNLRFWPKDGFLWKSLIYGDKYSGGGPAQL